MAHIFKLCSKIILMLGLIKNIEINFKQIICKRVWFNQKILIYSTSKGYLFENILSIYCLFFELYKISVD